MSFVLEQTMVESALVNITINGRAMQARAGQTVMEAATAAGIHIPGLCHHPHLKPEGACRLCLVEIEKQRTLQPACTFPVTEGMVVRTETEKVAASRKFALQMLFSERAHYCMFCAASGSNTTSDCELQKLGYKYGLDCWAFTPQYGQAWGLDASRKYFVMDHSRCILCRRCVRACNTIAANHTLGVHQRGARTLISADDNVPFGESSCISCGTCLQVCPTGALHDRSSAFMGHEAESKRTAAVCTGCAVACGIETLTRDNQLLRVEGSWEAGNGGLLCAAGRFEVLEPHPPRVYWPMIRQDGRLMETSWDKALTLIASRFPELRRVAGLISPRMTNEAITAFTCFFHEVLESNEVALLYGDVPPLDIGESATLAEVGGADCIVVIGGSPLEDQKVLGYLVKRAYDHGAKIIAINDSPTPLDPYAALHLRLEDISHNGDSPFERLRSTYHLRVSGLVQLRAAVEEAQRPVVLYGNGLSATVYAALRALPTKVRFLPLVTGTNAIGAARMGLSAHPVHGDGLYVLLGDDLPADPPSPKAAFTVVHAAYESAWTELADVVLPAHVWTEQRGCIINIEGRHIPVVPMIEGPKSVHAIWDALLRLSVRMGYALSYEQISDISMAL